MASTFQPTTSPEEGALSQGNLDNELIATLVLSSVITSSFTAARLVAKRSIGKFGIEDYLSATTWFLYMGYVAINIIQTEAGIGKHIWNIDPANAPIIAKTSWAIELLYCVLTFTSKAALLLQLQRIFAPGGFGVIYIACQTLLWANLAFYGSALISVIVQCVPQERLWDPSVMTGHCIDIGALLISMGAFNVFSDILILTLPIWAIWHLHIDTKSKLGVSVVFATGLLAVTSSICRLIYTMPPLHSEDSSYLFAPVTLWSMAELSSVITCTCFPLMPRFLQIIRGTAKPNPRDSHSACIKEPSKTRNAWGSKTSSGFEDGKLEATSSLHEGDMRRESQEDQSRLWIRRCVTIEVNSTENDGVVRKQESF